jgi:hypothetical protein
MQLQSLHQGSKNCSDYIQIAKECGDQLATIGKPIPNEDLISYLTNGLNPSFNSFITTISILSRDRQMSFEDFQDELFNHEMLLKHQQAQTVDTSTFALFNQKQGSRPFHQKPRGGLSPRFPAPNFSPLRFSSINFGPKHDAATPITRYNAVPPPAKYSSPSRYPAPRPLADSRPIFSHAP